jgi:hypothetical protein
MEDPDEIDAGSNLPVFEFGSATFEQLQTGSPPDPLYHYTGQEGLLGIMSTGQLRATKIQYMNDSTELGRAIILADKEIKKREIEPDQRELLSEVSEHLSAIGNINVCSVSFCRNPDLLSQWRGYSGSGAGYAIGFSTTALLQTAQNNHGRLGRCIYNESDQVKIVSELMDQVIREAVRYRDADPYALHFTLASAFENAIVKLGAFFKDPAFLEEDE